MLGAMTETADQIDAFVARWSASSAAERANCQPFLHELCELLDAPRPDPAHADDRHNAYVFERNVTFHHPDGSKSTGRIDLYKRGCFVLEAKQGSDQTAPEQLPLLGGTGSTVGKLKKGTAVRGTRGWDDAMVRARGQAESYAKALPAAEGWPPFLIVADVGHVFELYADFTGSGKHYTHFPDSSSFRIRLADLHRDDIRARLRLVWTDPHALDPSSRAARVTRDITARLAELAKSLEEHHTPERVAGFLMRCLFTMFAEDVGLLPADSYRAKLANWVKNPAGFRPGTEELWAAMNHGGFSAALDAHVPHFNGGLFADSSALELNAHQVKLLLDAAAADWSHVEPAIFGTLVERALNPRERHKLGAHYTPRAYVERLVLPTVIEPLRNDWQGAQAEAITLAARGDLDGAAQAVKRFHHRLCQLQILDPACGTGNFLYVALEHMKRLEGEVLDFLTDKLHEDQGLLELERHTVDPHQFLGLELNPRAAAIAELVLWIGYLQWHFRTRGKVMPAQPVLRNFKNIRAQDALLTWKRAEPVFDDAGRPLTRWDGIGKTTDLVTGRDIPDATARVPVLTYVEPRLAPWPHADFIIGNPPFIGGKDLQQELGEGYAQALWATHPHLPNSIDFVMYWWDRAAQAVRDGHATRFGFITTNSLPQTFSRRVVELHLNGKTPLSITFAIPDHPWVKALEDAGIRDAAAVRVAFSVGAAGEQDGVLWRSTAERPGPSDAALVDFAETTGKIHADLKIGANIPSALPLRANDKICSPGVKLHGSGFIVTPEQAAHLGLGTSPGLDAHIRPYLNGKDMTGRSRNVMVIDLFGLTETELRTRFPPVYQWVLERVKPERDHNNRDVYRLNWWIFGEPRKDLRPALSGLPRFIATVETAKHRLFTFLDGATCPDNMLVAIALDDSYALGVLSSRIHVTWALAAGGRLGIGNDPRYTKSACFDKFPFPIADSAQRQAIGALAQELDDLRRGQMAAHPHLTLTGLYNVLEKLRAGQDLTDTDRMVKDHGLVSLLLDLHRRLDRAVADAYGWPADLAEADILVKVVELNHQRAALEKQGQVHWLRPAYQAPHGDGAQQTEMAVTAAATLGKTAKPAWPKTIPDQAQALRALLAAPAAAADLTRYFKNARADKVTEVLDTLVVMGQARRTADGRYAA
ncbi:MAG: hypothetical protein FD176_3369 [Rhodospirillaceae bacterium]|nr:MAG: hypothetical protein FD176_3369 [Rhodospirillaceae bacterium]TNC93626.1 MAG: hypothetical protein FD119_3875 [Stygiobacter sp.]